MPQQPFVDPRLLEILAHETRMDIVNILRGSAASPKQLSERLGVRINRVNYHVKKLEDVGCIELTETKDRGSTVERFYRVAQLPLFETEAWAAIPAKYRRPIWATLLRLISGDVTHSLSAGIFGETPDSHLSRTPMVLDDIGSQEVAFELNQTLIRLHAIQANAMERLVGSHRDGLLVSVAMMQFAAPTRSSMDP